MRMEYDKFWLPVCLLGVATGVALFGAFNMLDEPPNNGCPKVLLKIFSYQVNEYFVPMDDEMVAKLCGKIVPPSTDAQKVPTEELQVSLKTVSERSVDEHADGVEITSQPSEKAPDLTEAVNETKVTVEQIAKIETIPSTDSVITPDLSIHTLTGPSDIDISDLGKDLQSLSEEPMIDELVSEKTSLADSRIEDTRSTGSIITSDFSRHHLIAPPGNIINLAKEFISKDVHVLPEKSTIDEVISEKSKNTSLRIEEILHQSAMFSPYVSPFFYLTTHIHTPAVIIQDLIEKPDFNDLLNVGSMFPPYISPFLFFPLPAHDKLTTLGFYKKEQDVDSISYKQVSEEEMYNNNPKIMKRKGMLSNEVGCSDVFSRLCSFNPNKFFIPADNKLMPEYCEALNDYHKCYFRVPEPPKRICKKKFTLKQAQDLMSVLCANYSSQEYEDYVYCAVMAIHDYFNLCKYESESLIEKIKKVKGMEYYEIEWTFENCIKATFRNDCYLNAIQGKCFGENFMKYDHILEDTGAKDVSCKNNEQYKRSREVIDLWKEKR